MNDYGSDALAEKRCLPQWLCNTGEYVCANRERKAGNSKEWFVSQWLVFARKLLRFQQIKPENGNSKEWPMSDWIFLTG